MKPNYKRYHIITQRELCFFEQTYRTKLLEWNEEYACEAIELSIHKPSEIANFTSLLLLSHEKTHLALVEQQYLTVLKKSLFNDTSECFDVVCQEIFLRLLREIFALNAVQLGSNSTLDHQWLYPGSACLNLTFNNTTDQFSFYLHPNWVLAQLPSTQIVAKPLAQLDDALATKTIEVTVQLEPLYLSVNQLLGLQVGDVIITTHLLTNPLHLHHHLQKIGTGTLGQKLQQKFIQLRRSS